MYIFFLVSQIMVWCKHEESMSLFKERYSTLVTFVRCTVNVILRRPGEIYKRFKREHFTYKSQQQINKDLIITMANILYRSKRWLSIFLKQKGHFTLTIASLPFVWSCQQKINAYIHLNHNMNFILWWHACQNQYFKPCLGRDTEEKLPGLTFIYLKQQQTLA